MLEQEVQVETEAEAVEKPADWLAPPALVSLLSYTYQDHLLRDGITHSGPGPPTSIIN